MIWKFEEYLAWIFKTLEVIAVLGGRMRVKNKRSYYENNFDDKDLKKLT